MATPAAPLYDADNHYYEPRDAFARHIEPRLRESGYNEMMSVHFGEQPNPPSHRQSAFQWTCFYGDRPIMDTLAALVFHNLFGRFPSLRILSVENGSLYVAYLFPHPEGLAEPRDFAAGLAGLAPDEVRRIMGENLRRVLAGGF